MSAARDTFSDVVTLAITWPLRSEVKAYPWGGGSVSAAAGQVNGNVRRVLGDHLERTYYVFVTASQHLCLV